jgi:hypothetical protein
VARSPDHASPRPRAGRSPADRLLPSVPGCSLSANPSGGIARQDLKAVEQEIHEVDSRYHPVCGEPLARAKGSVQYAAFLKGVAFCLKSGKRPAGLSGAEFHLLQRSSRRWCVMASSEPKPWMRSIAERSATVSIAREPRGTSAALHR